MHRAFGTLTSNISFEPNSGRQRLLTILAWCVTSAYPPPLCHLFAAGGDSALSSHDDIWSPSGGGRGVPIGRRGVGLLLYGSILSNLVSTVSNLNRAASLHRESMDSLCVLCCDITPTPRRRRSSVYE
eukprot:COSAG01_NODE_1315_length_10757_cov_13.246669_5_plen_128_part_00